jgi:PAS domain S-box-containing protein
MLDLLSGGVGAAIGAGALGLFSMFSRAWAQKHRQRKEDKAQNFEQDQVKHQTALTEYRELAESLEKRVKSLEDQRDQMILALAQCRGESAMFEGRVRLLEEQLRHLEKGVGPSGPVQSPGVIVANEAGLIIDVNSALTLLLHWTRDDLIGKPIRTVMPARYAEGHEVAFAKLVANQTAMSSEKVLDACALSKDGTEIPVTIRTRAWKEKQDGEWTFSASIVPRSPRYPEPGWDGIERRAS